jgi:hypothetical protein
VCHLYGRVYGRVCGCGLRPGSTGTSWDTSAVRYERTKFVICNIGRGDPVLCRLRTLEQFGRPVFPKGAMLGGHLEDLKDPGRFSGKGYPITFDRVILPYGDLAVAAKVIQAKKVKVSKTGDTFRQHNAESLRHLLLRL